jgi:hypothetical protein
MPSTSGALGMRVRAAFGRLTWHLLQVLGLLGRLMR